MINLQVIPFEELLQWKEKIQEELDRRDLYAFDITVKALFELHPEKKVLVLGMSYKAYDAPYETGTSSAIWVDEAFDKYKEDDIINFCEDEETKSLIRKLAKCFNLEEDNELYPGQRCIYYIDRSDPENIQTYIED